MRSSERKILCKTCLKKLRKVEATNMKKYRKDIKINKK